MNKPCCVFAEYYISCVLLCVCWIMKWCTGEMNLPLRLRCVRWYYALNKPCGVFVGLWMMYGRDESAPTPAVCSLLYIYALNKPCGVFGGLWMIVGRDKSAPTPTVCSLYTFTQWINLVVCLLNIIYPVFCCVFVGLWNDVRARWICPYAYGVFALYIYAMNKPCCVFAGLWMMYGRDESAPTPYGVFVDIYIAQ